MLIKLDTSDFTLESIETSRAKKKPILLTKSGWVRIDRIVMALIFLIAIVCSLVL